MTSNSGLNPTIALSVNGNIDVTFYSGMIGQHTVEIPMNANGMRLIKQILTAREQAQTRLGELGNPTQAIIDAWLKSKKVQDEQEAAERAKQAHDEFMSDWETECVGIING